MGGGGGSSNGATSPASAFNMATSFPPSQVKIWFQNRRSKFKKMWKSGELPTDQHAVASSVGSTSPPCSSSPPASATLTWDFAPHPQRMGNGGTGGGSSAGSSPGGPGGPAAAFLGNYSWYHQASSAAAPILQQGQSHQHHPHLHHHHHHSSAISAGAIF